MMGHVLTRRDGLDRATDESTKVIQNIRGVNDNISKARKKRPVPLRDSRKCQWQFQKQNDTLLHESGPGLARPMLWVFARRWAGGSPWSPGCPWWCATRATSGRWGAPGIAGQATHHDILLGGLKKTIVKTIRHDEVMECDSMMGSKTSPSRCNSTNRPNPPLQ